MWKHVDRLDLSYPVVFFQEFKVSCEGSRITGDIDDSQGGCLADLPYYIRVHSRPWRIDNHDIRFFRDIRQKHFDITTKELAIENTVPFAVLFCVEESAFEDFHPEDLSRAC